MMRFTITSKALIMSAIALTFLNLIKPGYLTFWGVAETQSFVQSAFKPKPKVLPVAVKQKPCQSASILENLWGGCKK